MRRIPGAAVVVVLPLLLLVLLGSGARAADPTATAIHSAGPLTNIFIGNELNCQVEHTGDTGYEFYDAGSELGACGTLLAIDGTLYGPSELPSAPVTVEPWTVVSQSPVAGSGTDADPLRVVTVVTAGETGLRIEETDSYVVGRESYRTDIHITNQGAGERHGILYRAGDCYLQDADTGFGRLDAGAPACLASQDQGSRLEQWLPLTPGSAAMEDDYDTVWTQIQNQQPFPGTCQCDTLLDNGGGLSWSVAIPAGGDATYSHLTLFSPEGRLPLTTLLAADAPATPPGGQNGYRLTIQNPNTTPVQLDGLFVQLDGDFHYLPGSTSGVTSADPAATGQRLDWSGAFQVPASANIAIHFSVTVAQATGAYQATAGATSPTDTVSPAEGSAGITVGGTASVPIRQSVPSPNQISLDPVVVAQSAAIAAGVVALVPFPSALFNSTLEQHYDEVVAPFLRIQTGLARFFAPFGNLWGRLRRRASRRRSAAGDASAASTAEPVPFFATPVGIALFVVVSALLYGLLDPTFGLSSASAGTFAGILIGLVITLLLYAIPYVRSLERDGVRTIPRALPGTLLVGAGCVLISRLANFQPGYLYGLIVGFVVSRHLSHAEEGRYLAIATATALAGALVAWLLLIVVRAATPAGPANPSLGDPGFVAAIVETACVTVVVAGLETAVFGLLPIKFLPGEKVYKYHRGLWLVLLGLGTFAFCHVVLNPSSGYLADTTRVSLATTLGLLAFFGVGSVAFWAYFRRRSRGGEHGPTAPHLPMEPGPPV